MREWQKGSTDRPREVHSLRGIFEKLSDNIMKLLEIKGRNVKDVPNSERSNFCSLAQRVSHNHKTRSSAFNVVLPSERTEFSRIPLHTTDEKRTYSEFPDSEKLNASLTSIQRDVDFSGICLFIFCYILMYLI